MREYKGSAEVYRKAKKADYDNANQKAEQARKRGDFEKAKEAEKEIDQLNERILQLLADMKERLMTIPRESQKQAREQAAAGKKPDDKPAVGKKPPAGEKAPTTGKTPAAKPEKKTEQPPKPESKPKDKGNESSSDKPEPPS
jgi:hypothetical protein